MKKFLIVLLFVSKLTYTQESEVEQALFFIVEHYGNDLANEGVVLEELESLLEHHYRVPLKINSCTLLQLLDFPLLKQQQAFHVLSYRRRYGDFRSLKEMELLPQFSKGLLKVLLPFLDFSKGKVKKYKRTKFRLVGTSKGALIKDSAAYDYLGSDVYQAIKIEINDVFPGYSIALNTEKDRGELWYHPSKRVEHVNFNLYYDKEENLLSHLILGTYKASFGQGLVLHSGYNSYKSRFVHGGGSFNKRKVRPQSSNEESSYFKGGAIEFSFLNLKLSALASLNKFDATVYADSTSDYFSSIDVAGMHRNELELSKKDNVSVIDFGIVTTYSKDDFNVSWNHLFSELSLPIKRPKNYYNSEYLLGSRFYTQSLDFNYLWRYVHFFGELAVDKEFDFALLSGVSGSVVELFNYRVLYRSYSRGFQSFRGKSYQQNGQLRNEKGIVFQVDGRFGNGFSYHAFRDFYLFPEMSYRKRFSARGNEQAIKLSYANNEGFECYAKAKSKEGQKNLVDRNSYTQADEKRSSFRLNYRLKIKENLRMGGQFEYLYYSSDTNKSSGVLLFQEVKHSMEKITYGPRITVFSIDDYNARIYVYEPSLKYSSPFLFFKDTGISFSVKMKYQIDEHFSLSAKWYATFLQNKHTMDLNSTSRSGVNVQCSLKF